MDSRFAYKKSIELLLALLAGVVLYLQLRALDIILAIWFLPESKEHFALAWGSALSLTAVFFSCIVRPLIEEFIFRRKLYEFLSKRSKKWMPMVLSATIFCLAHYQYYGTLYMVNTFLMALVFQVIMNSSGSIVTAATCHGAYNFCVLSPKPSVTDIQLALGIPELDLLWFAWIVLLPVTGTLYALLRSLLKETKAESAQIFSSASA